MANLKQKHCRPRKCVISCKAIIELNNRWQLSTLNEVVCLRLFFNSNCDSFSFARIYSNKIGSGTFKDAGVRTRIKMNIAEETIPYKPWDLIGTALLQNQP